MRVLNDFTSEIMVVEKVQILKLKTTGSGISIRACQAYCSDAREQLP